MVYEFLEDWGKYKKGDKVKSDKDICKKLCDQKIMKKFDPKPKTRKKKVIENAPKNK